MRNWSFLDLDDKEYFHKNKSLKHCAQQNVDTSFWNKQALK